MDRLVRSKISFVKLFFRPHEDRDSSTVFLDPFLAPDGIVPLGAAHLRRSISEFVRHYRFERNHQGLANEPIESTPSPAYTNGRVERRKRLGGLLNFYCREAA